MALCLRRLCRSFRCAPLRKDDLSRTIFGVKKTHLVPKAPEGFSLEEFSLFYYFPGIRIISVLGSAKYLKATVCGGISCVSYLAYTKELITADICATIICTGVYCTLGMFLTAYLCKNFIGKMYVNKKRTEVVIAYVNSKGQRINKTFKSDELKLSDHPNSIAKKYVKQVTCPEKNLKYYLYDSKGVKMDILVFSKIFPTYT